MCRSMLSAVFALSLLAGSARAQGPVSVAVEPHSNGRLVVSVRVNGAGPYPFLVDTGASMTLLDAALFKELNIKPQGKVGLASARGESLQELGIADEIAVDGLSVAPISVLRVTSLDIGPVHVRGILGENFLSHFDILIDNQHGRISLDAGDALMDQLAGEKLPMMFDEPVDANGVKVRPTVSVNLAAYGSAPLTLLLDSAADTVVVRAWKNRHRTSVKNGSEQKLTVHSVYGSVACESWEDELRLGKFRANGVRLMDCGNGASTKLGDEGSLPTSAFRQIFVSHSGSYVMLNPVRRGLVPEVVARHAPPSVTGTE